MDGSGTRLTTKESGEMEGLLRARVLNLNSLSLAVLLPLSIWYCPALSHTHSLSHLAVDLALSFIRRSVRSAICNLQSTAMIELSYPDPRHLHLSMQALQLRDLTMRTVYAAVLRTLLSLRLPPCSLV